MGLRYIGYLDIDARDSLESALDEAGFVVTTGAAPVADGILIFFDSGFAARSRSSHDVKLAPCR